MKTIVFTGGHHNSALEVAKALKPKYQIVWFGHKHTMKDDSSLSFEYQEVTEHNLQFIDLKSGKFYKPSQLREWARIPLGFMQAFQALSKIKPKLIVAFGGYLSPPVVLAGYLLGIPSVCHEQTTQAGLANRFNSYFVKKVFLTWPESYQWFPMKKTVVTGLPLRKTAFGNLDPIVDFPTSRPTILVTGGKQGSHIINEVVGQSYPELLHKYNIIHQTGGLHKTNDFSRLGRLKEKLIPEQQERLWLRKYFFQKEMCQALQQSDLVVCRAGGHTVYELISLGKPCLLIPLRSSMTKEQISNAQKAKNLGIGEVLYEEQLSFKTLILKLEEMIKNLDHYRLAGEKAKKSIKRNATKLIVAEIEKLL
jgi:UDP-N-acetylglucosamine--N-acetylmuramyl-(pentapeptide) pyrophosphoryl-undecaprenol N-acetylglucosamine transferase